MSGKKGMKQTKKRKPLTQEQKDKIRQTMKEKWKDKEYRERMLKQYVESTGRKIVFIWEHEINDEWFCVLDYLM